MIHRLNKMDAIRQFRPEDSQFCCSLIYDCLDSDTTISFSLREKLRRGESPQIMQERAKMFYLAVYESESGIIGLAGIDLNEIRLLYVSPKRRRSGVGRALFNHLAAMAPESFFRDIFVYSSPGAVGFYKALGFVEKGSVSFPIEEEAIRTIFMIRPTTPSFRSL